MCILTANMVQLPDVPIATDTTEEVHEEYRVRAGLVDTTNVNPTLALTEALHSEQIVKFPAPCLEIPRIIWGLSAFSNEGSRGLRVSTAASNINKDQFTLTPSTWFTASYIQAAWMKIPSSPEARFQSGEVDTVNIPRKFDRDRAGLPDVISFYVSFSAPYKTPPTVQSWLTHIDLTDSAHNSRIDTTVENVTTNGFLLTIVTWADSQLFSARAFWLAYNAAAPGIASGIQDTTFVDVPTKKVSFPAGTFTKAPQMFVGFRHIDADQTIPVRMKAQASNVTATDFEIASCSWSRPGLPEGRVTTCRTTWLAIE